MLKLRTLGGLTVERVDLSTPTALQRRPLALLTVLASAGDLGVTRDKLVAYFWPESDEDRARNVLRQLLHTIRRDLAVPDLLVGTTELRLNRFLITSDFAEFERACDASDFEAAVGLYTGSFLDGFYLSNAPGFESWKEGERTRLARRFMEAAEKAARAAAARGDHPRAIGMWQRMAVTEPLNSRIAIELMRAMAVAGDTGGALKHARVHEILLREELGAAPPQELIRVAREIDAIAVAPPISLTDAAPSHAAAVSAKDAVGGEVRYAAASPPAGLGRRSFRHAFSGRAAIAAVVFGVACVGALIVLADRARPRADLSTYLLLPFVHDPARSPESFSGAQLDALLRDAFSSWRDLRLVDELRVNDALARDARALTLERALAIARGVGAGRVVWGRTREVGDSIYVRATLYDVATRRTVAESAAPFARGTADPRLALRILAADLVRGYSGPPDVSGAALGTRSVGAWQAYDSAQRALARWELDATRQHLRHAVAVDPDFALANLWLAQVNAWLHDDRGGEGHRAAMRAIAKGEALSRTDRARAHALGALANGDYVGACAGFQRVLAHDSLDFAAWYGLGDCQARDSLVLPDSTSPSGWRFRSSYHGAVRAYTRALDLVPSFSAAFREEAFTRLAALLFTEAWRYRPGLSTTAGDSANFAAFPSLAGDTLSFIPFSIPDIRSERLRGHESNRLGALRRNRALLRGLLGRWVAAFPNDIDAVEAYALALETSDDIESSKPDSGVLGMVRRARAMVAPGDRVRQIRLAVTEVRLLVKAGALERAARVSDSTLAGTIVASTYEASLLAGLAALGGRVHLAASLLEQSAADQAVGDAVGRPVRSPMRVTAAAQRLLAYASFAGPADSLQAAHAEFERRVRALVDPRSQPAVRAAHLRRPLRLAYAQLGALLSDSLPRDGDPLVELARSVSPRDSLRFRHIHAEVIGQRLHLSPSDIGLDQVLQESVLLLAVGDTTTAIKALDASLDGLSSASTRLLTSVPVAAAVGQMFVLRAELAARRSDRDTARRRATQALALWGNADGAFAARVRRMRELARPAE